MLKFSLLFAAAFCELISASASAAAPAAAAAASSPTTGYNQPQQNILDVMRAPSPPAPSVSPTQDKMVLVSWQDYPPMARVAEPYLKLAGVRIEPRNHSKHDTPGGYGITPCATGFELVSLPAGASVPVKLPAGCPQGPVWSADGKRFAFANLAADAVELWIGDAATGAIRKVPGVRLNPMFGDDFQWLPDQKTLLVKLVPEKLGAPPPEPVIPAGPSIQETTGSKGQSSTYETRDTLNNTHDEALFDHFATTQLATVDAVALKATPLGKPGIYDGLGMAPDGKHLLVETIHRPYSYVTTYDRFPHKVEIWDITQRTKIAVHEVADLPLADRVPIRGVPLGPRNYSWRATDPATLVWAEALDSGDWKVEVPARDKVMMHKAPFTAAPVEIARTTQRYAGLAWTEKPNLAFLTEYDSNKHWRKTFIKDVDQPQAAPRLLFDLSTDEKYANPGNFVFKRMPSGENVVRLEGDSVYLSGTGSSQDGDRPFLDKLDLGTLKTQRLFRSDKTSYEQFLRFLGKEGSASFMTWRQSPSDAPNAFLRTLGKPIDGAEKGEATVESTRTAITHIADPSPVVRQISKRLVKYKRADGLELSFTLYTPPGYKEGTRVPTILYAYPLDYADASKAGQVTGSQMTFTRLRQYRLLLLAGYAIIDNAAFPIVGDPKRAYDTYLEQLVADAKAAVDEAVRIGVADPDRVGVTGHSHGALMTANLVAHSDLFRAGIATSGSYNKTLTPFGFQNESRSVWEAPDVYSKVSTFFTADKLKTPLLIMHGGDDANPGTTPLQSVKLYEAIRGNGGTARLVILPHEPHWYTAAESNEQQVYEMVRWFDKYVKNAAPKAVPPSPGQ